MNSSAESLLCELHGNLLRALALAAGQHFQGVSQASRFLKHRRRISPVIANKLLKIDFAFNLIRHITYISARSFETDVAAELRRTSTTEHKKYDLDAGRFGLISDESESSHGTAKKGTHSSCHSCSPVVDQSQAPSTVTPGLDTTSNSITDFASTPTVKDHTTQSGYFIGVEHETVNEFSRHEISCIVHADTHDDDETSSVVQSFFKKLNHDLNRQDGVYTKFYHNGRHLNMDKPSKGDRGRRNSLRRHWLSAEFQHDNASLSAEDRAWSDTSASVELFTKSVYDEISSSLLTKAAAPEEARCEAPQETYVDQDLVDPAAKEKLFRS